MVYPSTPVPLHHVLSTHTLALLPVIVAMAGKRLRRFDKPGLNGLTLLTFGLLVIVLATPLAIRLYARSHFWAVLVGLLAVYTAWKYVLSGIALARAIGYAVARGSVLRLFVIPLWPYGRKQPEDDVMLLALYNLDWDNSVVAGWVSAAASCPNLPLALLRLFPAIHSMVDFVNLPPDLRLGNLRTIRTPFNPTQMRIDPRMSAEEVLRLEKQDASHRRIMEARRARTMHWEQRLDTEILMLKVAASICATALAALAYSMIRYW